MFVKNGKWFFFKNATHPCYPNTDLLGGTTNFPKLKAVLKKLKTDK